MLDLRYNVSKLKMNFREKVCTELQIDHTDSKSWNKRHIIQSSKSGVIIPKRYLKRKSIIRDMGKNIIIKSDIDTLASKKDYIHNFRYWSALLDWDLFGNIDKRITTLINICNKNDKKSISKLLEFAPNNIIHPSDLDGYENLTTDEKNFCHLLFIHSYIPENNILEDDMQLNIGVGSEKAKKYISEGILVPDILFTKLPPLLFNPNKNHVGCLVDKITYIEEKDFDIVGGFGRGKESGHDIDIMIKETDLDDFKNIFKKLESIVINSKSYIVSLLDTLVRVDISTYTKNNKLTSYLHFLGPYQLNIWMRKQANQRGYTLSQHGLYKNGKLIETKSESDLNRLIGVPDNIRTKWWNRY